MILVVFGFCCQFLSIQLLVAQKKDALSFVYKTSDYGQKSNTTFKLNEQQNPARYEAYLNLPVCDDNLCANVVVNMYWDLAGNYSGFDTLAGKPLTKFDHRPFTPEDYKKLNEILADKNSILRVLEKDELTDKSVQLKSSTIDAVSGATPASVKEQVVEGAVYSAFTLWHFVNGSVKDSIRHFTQRIFSNQLALHMLQSPNHETQLFALQQVDVSFFESNALLIFDVMTKSSPLVRVYIINKMPLPFKRMENNKAFAALYTKLDSYSKSVYQQRVNSTKSLADIFLPLLSK